MPVLIVRDGGVVTKDPADQRVILVDWDTDNLPDTAQIAQSTFTITRLSGSSDTPLTHDSAAIMDGGRNTQLRIVGGALGSLWRVDNTIVTNESPAQTKDRHFKVWVQQK